MDTLGIRSWLAVADHAPTAGLSASPALSTHAGPSGIGWGHPSPVDGVGPFRNPALLVAIAMLFVSVVAALDLIRAAALGTDFGAAAIVSVALSAVALVLGVGLIRLRRLGVPAVVLVGFGVLDFLPASLQLAGQDPVAARGLVVLLVLPAVIGSICLSRWVHRGHLAVVLVMAAAMTAPPGDRALPERLLEAALAVGVLAAADVLIRRLSQATEERVGELRTLSLTDGLTGVLNRRGLMTGFAELARSSRRDSSIGLLVIDIDHFKWINDEHGHAAGDEILRHVCAVLGRVVGPADLVARIGGEELAAAVVGPAEPVAEEFRAALRAEVPMVTVSVGIVDVTHDDAVLARAAVGPAGRGRPRALRGQEHRKGPDLPRRRRPRRGRAARGARRTGRPGGCAPPAVSAAGVHPSGHARMGARRVRADLYVVRARRPLRTRASPR